MKPKYTYKKRVLTVTYNGIVVLTVTNLALEGKVSVLESYGYGPYEGKTFRYDSASDDFVEIDNG